LHEGIRSPLANNPWLAEYGVELVDQPGAADWIFVPRAKLLVRFFLKFPGKRYLVYTNEPRDSRTTSKQFRPVPFFPEVEVMNVFTGDVFWHNFHFLGSYHYDISGGLDVDIRVPLRPLSSKDLAPANNQRPVAAFISYRLDRDTSYVIDGTNRDLEVTRSSYALALHQAGLCDIYGSNWPPGVSKENSGYGSSAAVLPWWVRKLSLLPGYRYNLCPENTIADYYCTEKIWHAIQGENLPIYRGANTTIFEKFPKNSFIDLVDFDTPESLIHFLQMLPEKEYLERTNICREVFNRCIAERRETIAEDPRLHLQNILKRLRP